MTRVTWQDSPSTATPLSASFLNNLEARKVETDETPINLLQPPYSVVLNDSGTSAKTANVSGVTAAIEQANIDGRLIQVPPGELFFTAGHAFPVLGVAPGMIGVPGRSRLTFDKNGDCIVMKGSNSLIKRMSGLYCKNVSTSHTSLSAVIRLQNSTYGDYDNLFVQHEHANSAGIILEHVYDGSAADAEFIAHIGCWYNTFRNLTSGYLTVTDVNIGSGIYFRVDATAIGVVDPPGQVAGTYTGSVGNNVILGMNVEGKAKGLHLERSTVNVFTGGQFLQNTDQVWATDSGGNSFIGLKHNQWGTRPYNLATASCFSNSIISPILSHGIAQPWSLGITGARPIILATDEGILQHGLTLNDIRLARLSSNALSMIGSGTTFDLNRPDDAGAAIRLGNGAHTVFGNTEFWNAAGSQNFFNVVVGQGAVQLVESSEPAAAPANSGYFFARDNGSGKTQLCAKFPTGAVQVIATEP